MTVCLRLKEGLAQIDHGNLANVLYFATVCVIYVPNLKDFDYTYQNDGIKIGVSHALSHAFHIR